MNGVFNGARIVHDGKTHNFSCAIWRWHPKTKKFELFARGNQQSVGTGLQPPGRLVRILLRDRSSLSHDPERLLPPPGRTVSAGHA